MLTHDDAATTMDAVKTVLHAGLEDAGALVPFGGMDEFETIVPALTAIHDKFHGEQGVNEPQKIAPDLDILAVDICTVLNILYRIRHACSRVIDSPGVPDAILEDTLSDADVIDHAIAGWISVLSQKDQP
jgi:hypothetical protein